VKTEPSEAIGQTRVANCGGPHVHASATGAEIQAGPDDGDRVEGSFHVGDHTHRSVGVHRQD
jgi:hypothetical protein